MQLNENESKIKWENFLAGDNNAYSWLYTTYIQTLFMYGMRFTSDSELVKDCIQDVFTKLYKNRNTLVTPDNIKLYLYISLKNCLLNMLSKQSFYDDADPETFVMSSGETVEDNFIEDESIIEKRKEVKRILNILTPRQREIIYYRYVEELDFDQICMLMGLNYQSAHNLIQRSLKKIREYCGSIFIFVLFLKSCN